jgi:ABC-type transporter Mla subunit MlaD
MESMQELRERAAEVLRAATAERREAEKVQRQAQADLAGVALAAVEALETLADALDGVQDELPAGVRDLVRLSTRAAWERLEAAGIVLDGRAGEPLDLGRHRVLKTVPGALPGTVAAVIAPGVRFAGTRVRDAVVTSGAER